LYFEAGFPDVQDQKAQWGELIVESVEPDDDNVYPFHILGQRLLPLDWDCPGKFERGQQGGTGLCKFEAGYVSFNRCESVEANIQ